MYNILTTTIMAKYYMEEVFSLKDGGYDFAPFEYEDDPFEYEDDEEVKKFSVTTSTSKQQTYGTQTYRKMYIHSSSISPKVRKRNFGECLNNSNNWGASNSPSKP